MQQLVIRQPDDFHVHLRQGADCGSYAKDVWKAGFGRVLVMPNTLPPITTPSALSSYKRQIEVAAHGLEALMTFKIMKDMTAEDLLALKKAGAVAGKLYPAGVTTHSEDGITVISQAYPVLAQMEELGLVLCLHGEHPQAFSLDREQAFLPELKKIHKNFPRLKVILEHISTAQGVNTVRDLGPQVAGTITIHHLLYTLDDLLGGSLHPHLFCKPLLKRPQDRQALKEAALSGYPQFFFGSDSAPHHRESKESALCSAGIYTMPVALPLLAQFFEESDALDKMEPFVSYFGADFYGLTPNSGSITLLKEPWVVSKLYHNVVPFRSGETLPWQVLRH